MIAESSGEPQKNPPAIEKVGIELPRDYARQLGCMNEDGEITIRTLDGETITPNAD